MLKRILVTRQVTYAAPGLSSGHAALQVAHKFWNGSENSSGDYAQMGFLYLYELLTGTKKVKILDTDCSRSFAVLLAELVSDRAETAFLPSILSSICRFPHLAGMMPKYKDNRKFKNSTIAATDAGEDSSGNEVIGPLGSLLAGCMSVLQAEIYNLMMMQHPNATSMFPAPSDDPIDVSVPPLSSMVDARQWIVPQISNYSCSKGTLETIGVDEINVMGLSVPATLTLSASDLDAFTSQPLKDLNFSECIQTVTSLDPQRPHTSSQLPFDVSSHRMADSAIAKSMVSRLETDVADYANAMNTEPKKRMEFLNRFMSAINESGRSSFAVESKHWVVGMDMMNTLISELERLRSIDSTYIGHALSWLMDQVNNVSTSNASAVAGEGSSVEHASADEKSLYEKRIFELRRFSGQETRVWLEFLFGTMLSSTQFADLQKLNPFLTSSQVDTMNQIVCAAVLHANRIGQINRCLLDARGIQKTMHKIGRLQRETCLADRNGDVDLTNGTLVVDKPTVSSLMHDVVLKADSLILNLEMGRHYVDKADHRDNSGSPSGHEGGETKRQRFNSADRYTFDPRFLLFEFTWNILLRKVQVEMVRDYISDLRQGTSSVKQMIMGNL